MWLRQRREVQGPDAGELQHWEIVEIGVTSKGDGERTAKEEGGKPGERNMLEVKKVSRWRGWSTGSNVADRSIK